MKPINTVAGPINFISFSKFVSLLPTRKLEKNSYQFNTCLGYEVESSPYFESRDIDNESNYKRLVISLNNKIPEAAILTGLEHQVGIKIVFKDNIINLLEDAAAIHASEFGEPQYAVRLKPRSWILVNLGDFELIHGDDGFGFACLAQCRTEIVQILKFTKEEALEQLRLVKNS